MVFDSTHYAVIGSFIVKTGLPDCVNSQNIAEEYLDDSGWDLPKAVEAFEYDNSVTPWFKEA